MTFLPREKQVQIGDVLYKIRELKASERSILLFRTNELLGGSIESFIRSFMADTQDYVAIGGIFTGLARTTSPETLNKFIKDTIITCVISPESACVDTDSGYEMHFCEYYYHLQALLGAIYDQNFGSTYQTIKKKLTDLGASTLKSSEKTETDEGKDGRIGLMEKVQTQTKIPLVSTNF